jgi:predicted AAA+ superfamily ATPase
MRFKFIRTTNHSNSSLHFQTTRLKMPGKKRASESLLRSCLELFPCVAVLGVRQCGKTTLLETLPSHWL